MVVSTFSVLDKNDKERFFKESFLLTEIKSDMVLRMTFLTMSNADINFQAWDLQWRSYTTGNVLSITRRVELIRKKEFAAAVLELEHDAFVVHIAALSVNSGD